MHLAIERRSSIPSETVFWFWGRPLRVVRSVGDDAAAPVIVEELADSGQSLKGQLALWSLDSVRRVMAGNDRAKLAAALLKASGKAEAEIIPLRGRRHAETRG